MKPTYKIVDQFQNIIAEGDIQSLCCWIKKAEKNNDILARCLNFGESLLKGKLNKEQKKCAEEIQAKLKNIENGTVPFSMETISPIVSQLEEFPTYRLGASQKQLVAWMLDLKRVKF